MKKLFILLLFCSSSMKNSPAACRQQLPCDSTITKTLGSDLVVQSGGAKEAILNRINLKKGCRYLITVTLMITPDRSPFASHGKCQENTIERRFNGRIMIIDPFHPDSLIKEYSIPELYRIAPHFDTFGSLFNQEQVQAQFALEASNMDRVYQLFFQNGQSTISYRHSCGCGNCPGGLGLPLILAGSSAIEISAI